MTEKARLFYLRYLFYVLITGITFIYLCTYYPASTSLHLTLLIWSLYILCIPGSHGQIALGFPLHFIMDKPFHTEPLMWAGAIVLNIGTFLFASTVYWQTIPTYFLYRIITTPNPYWLIILVSALGTFYAFLIGERPGKPKFYKHKIIRHLLILTGIFTFLYLSHQEIIILLNARL